MNIGEQEWSKLYMVDNKSMLEEIEASIVVKKVWSFSYRELPCYIENSEGVFRLYFDFSKVVFTSKKSVNEYYFVDGIENKRVYCVNNTATIDYVYDAENYGLRDLITDLVSVVDIFFQLNSMI
jgi:hypothetical protein